MGRFILFGQLAAKTALSMSALGRRKANDCMASTISSQSATATRKQGSDPLEDVSVLVAKRPLLWRIRGKDACQLSTDHKRRRDRRSQSWIELGGDAEKIQRGIRIRDDRFVRSDPTRDALSLLDREPQEKLFRFGRGVGARE